MRGRTIIFVALLVSAHGAGCAARRGAAKQALPPPVRATTAGYLLGSPLDPPKPSNPPNAAAAGAGAGVGAIGGGSGDAFVIRLEGYAVRNVTAGAGEPLAARGGLVIDSVNEPSAAAPP